MPESPPDAKTLFGRASNLPPADRAAFLDVACGGDAALRAQVDAVLAAVAGGGDFLACGGLGEAGDPAATSAFAPGNPLGELLSTVDYAGPQAGRVLAGRYKLLEPVGEGGMGTVWMAEQRDPVKRTVAVKLIKAGLDSRGTMARFEAERQALALMDHPNIAKILDAGAADDGRPFFVMELVKGVPITTYCDQHKLTPRERLALFVPVCQAVQHAHQKGVIHRDLKPGNVLVAEYDGRPVPKVIDFGVAKAVGPQLTETTLHTGFGAVVGTPEYMSPEQATFNALDVDTRTDVYALGVLLYELLAGAPPFRRKELQLAGLAEMLRVIREVEPPKPSTKISTADALPSIAANRKTEPKALTGLVRGELDWIVMKALEKDRRRRYETAAGFAQDVERYLAGDAVEAAPPSRAYRLRKFVRRNRTGLAVVAVVLVALAAGVIGTTVGLVRAERARADATTAATNARRLADSLRHLIETADPQAGGGGPFTVRRLLDGYAATLEHDAAGQPEVEADLRLTVGRAYAGVDAAAQALPHLRRAVELRREHLGPRHPATAEALTSLALTTMFYNAAGETKTADLIHTAERAEADAAEAVDILRHAPDAPKEWLARALLAVSYARSTQDMLSGRPRANERYAREALALTEPPAGQPPTRLTADAAFELAFALRGPGQEAEQGAAYERAWDFCRRTYPDAHPVRANVTESLAYFYARTNRPAEAAARMQEALTTYREVYNGTPHVDYIRVANSLIELLDGQFRDAEAAKVAADVSPDWAGQKYRVLTVGRRNLMRSKVYVARGDLAEAERFAAAAVEYLDKNPQGENADTLLPEARYWQAIALAGLDRRDEAHALLAAERDRIRKGWADEGMVTLENVLKLLLGPDNHADLKPSEELARRWLAKNEAASKGERAFAHTLIAWSLQARGQDAAALNEWPLAMTGLADTRRPDTDLGLLRTSYFGWAQVLVRQRDFAKAEEVLRQAAGRDDGLPADHLERAARRVLLADFLLADGRPREADAELTAASRLLAAHPQARSDSLTRRRLPVFEPCFHGSAVDLWQRVRL